MSKNKIYSRKNVNHSDQNVMIITLIIYKQTYNPSQLVCQASDYMMDGSVLELTRMNQFNMLFTATCNNLDINPNLRSIGLVLMLETNL